MCRAGIIQKLLKNDSGNVKIASAVKVTLALCACCLLAPKNSWFLFSAPPFLFLSHFCLGLSCHPFLICALFVVFLCIFYWKLSSTAHFCLSAPRSSLFFPPHLPLGSYHSLLLNPLIFSVTPPSLHLTHLFSDFPQDFFLLSPPPLPAFPVSSLSSSRMSEFCEEPRFTIEQIDLLQRLRRSGMTKQEILHALDTLDRLDREHGDKFGHRTSSSSSSSSYGVGVTNNCTNNSASNTATPSFNNNTTASATTTTSSVSCNGNNKDGGESGGGEHPTAAAASSSTTSKISTATQTQFNSGGGLSPSLSNSYDTSPPPGPPPPSAILPSPMSLLALSQNGRDSLAATPNGKLSPPRYPVNSAAATRAFGFEGSEEDMDIDDKVEELMRWEPVKLHFSAFVLTDWVHKALTQLKAGIAPIEYNFSTFIFVCLEEKN